MKYLIFSFFILLVIGGCAELLKLQGQAAEQAANGILAYCNNTDQAFRTKFEAEVAAKAFPNTAKITCTGDTTQ